jgi:hypothetical protein
MSDVFTQARKELNELKNNIKLVVKETFEEYKSLIVHYNADEQMYDKGQDAKGSLIRPAYKPMTIRIKKAKGQPTDRVTLRDTGRFHKTLIVTPKEDYVEITSDVYYAKYLFDKYGSNILGIQEELLKEFVKRYVVPNIKKEAEKRLKR